MNNKSYNIRIENCNNIKNGEIKIYLNKLNIMFGHNGTGKSTIARAISLSSQNNELTELTPYGSDEDDSFPKIEGFSNENIAIFDEKYVSKYVYQADTLLENTFEVMLRSTEYDEAKKNIDEALIKIKTFITDRQEIIDLKNNISELINKIKMTKDNKIARRGGAKGILEGKGAYFNPPEELSGLDPFFEEETVSKWAEWRMKGFEKFGDKGCCPYCSTGDSKKSKQINEIFKESFDKTSIEIAAAIRKILDALSQYLNKEKIIELLSLFGVKDNLEVLESKLTKLLSEADYLYNKLNVIVSFNGSSVDRDNLSNLESRLKDMKIDSRGINEYFVSEMMKKEVDAINTEVDNLLKKVNLLKGEIGKYNKYIQEKIKNRKQDINEFLSIAGFRYSFDVELNGENNARALLKFIKPDGATEDLKFPENHLSWGEKNAFALILFMFDAISKNANLIILDDPISSFDSNKKYAIINRLFKTGDRENSLYQRTVLMLTHDFEPVIDYVQVGSGRQDSSYIFANYLENNNGKLTCTPIKKNSDLMSFVVLLKEIAKDSNIDIAARIGCLRKYIEHQDRYPSKESDAYNILSSLIHRRAKPTYDSEGNNKLNKEQKLNGENFIRKYILDFDYDLVLEQLSPENLIERYTDETSSYIKILILRAYIEHNPKARERLRETNDVLRKYVDETYHIENDYIYSLDVRRFNIVPEHYMEQAEIFVEKEKQLLSLKED